MRRTARQWAYWQRGKLTPSDDLAPSALNSILKQSGLKK
jgi:hypothetical protein